MKHFHKRHFAIMSYIPPPGAAIDRFLAKAAEDGFLAAESATELAQACKDSEVLDPALLKVVLDKALLNKDADEPSSVIKGLKKFRRATLLRTAMLLDKK